MALLTVEDLEKDSQVSRFTWRTWIAAGDIRSIRLGRRVRVDEADYLAFKEANAKLGRAPVRTSSSNGTSAPPKPRAKPKPRGTAKKARR